MKTYEVRYHEVGKQCCGRRPTPSRKIKVRANSEDEAREILRKKIPTARFETIREV